jgi:hypothetical protein
MSFEYIQRLLFVVWLALLCVVVVVVVVVFFI